MMLWFGLLLAVVFVSSSDGCSRLCPCRREIENITQRLDSLGQVEDTFISQVANTMVNMTRNMDMLLRNLGANQKLLDTINRLVEKVDDMAFGKTFTVTPRVCSGKQLP